MTTTGLFGIEREGDVLVVTPTADLREFRYEDIEAGARGILDLLGPPGITGVVLDFCKTDSYGSTALGFFLRLWKRISSRGGRMAFCNVSDHEKEILQITKLDHSWPICSSRSEALEAVKE